MSGDAGDPVFEMGELLEPGTWCRQRWCREKTATEHFDGDGCSCHRAQPPDNAHDESETETHVEAGLPDLFTVASPLPAPPVLVLSASAPARIADLDLRLTILTAKASRLSAFACRACGCQTRRMIEAPAMFFRCEDCARANRWPPSRRQA